MRGAVFRLFDRVVVGGDGAGCSWLLYCRQQQPDGAVREGQAAGDEGG
jgi:hypothetical protein